MRVVIMKKRVMQEYFSIVIFNELYSSSTAYHAHVGYFIPMHTMLILTVRSNEWIPARLMNQV